MVGPVPKARLGVALLLPPAVAAEVDGLRRALGDRALGRIAPHVTLVPPVNVPAARLGDALGVLRAAAAACPPLTLDLGPPGTFAPATPVVHLRVGGPDPDVAALAALREAVFRPPLARPLTWPWVPHVTLVDGAEPDRITAAVAALAGYRATVALERVHLLEEGRGRVWTPVADAAFAAPAVVGRGGPALELDVTDGPGPEAAALLAGGRPFTVTARRDGAVVGAARGWTGAGEARLEVLAVAAGERGTGVGSRLLAAVESLAAGRGCTAVLAVVDGPGDLAGFLRHRGWVPEPGRPGLGLRRRLG